jgi:hypothetical protein
LALGVVVAAGFFGWINFYHIARLSDDIEQDLPSAVGRALRDAGDQPVVVVSANALLEQRLNEPVVQLLASERDDLAQMPTISPRNWPSLTPGTRILLAPGDSALQSAIEAAYPNFMLTVMRDLHANPLLYVYDLIDTASMPEP